jgi:hypothetical protein
MSQSNLPSRASNQTVGYDLPAIRPGCFFERLFDFKDCLSLWMTEWGRQRREIRIHRGNGSTVEREG